MFGEVIFRPFGEGSMHQQTQKAPPIENSLPRSLEQLYKGTTKKMRISREIADTSDEFNGLLLDYSRQCATQETMKKLFKLAKYMFGIAGAKLVERIRALSFERVVHQEIGWFDDPMNSSGAIGSRLSANASTMRTLVGDALALVARTSQQLSQEFLWL